MATSKVSISLDDDVLAEARRRAGRRELSAFINEALRRQLQHDRIREFLDEMEAKHGPIPEELREEARKIWRGNDARSARRRSG